MIGRAVPTAAKSDDRHTRRDCCCDADGAVLDDDAVLLRHTELPGCKQKEVGRGLALRDLRRAEDVRIEKRQQPGHRERVVDSVEMAVGRDAARDRQRCEQFLDPRNCGQLVFEGDVDMRTEGFEKPIGQGAPEPGLDLGRQRGAILAETEHHRLGHRDRKIGCNKTLAENPAEDDLAVDQHPIAIEDDESWQSLSLGGTALIWPRVLICHPRAVRDGGNNRPFRRRVTDP